MTKSLKKFLESRNINKDGQPKKLKVLVTLNVSHPDDKCLKRLKEIGLSIEDVIDHIVIGSIAADKEEALKADPLVSEVERSQKLDFTS
jgi:hypothetical protein